MADFALIKLNDEQILTINEFELNEIWNKCTTEQQDELIETAKGMTTEFPDIRHFSLYDVQTYLVFG